MYLAAASTISHQPTFRNPGFSQDLQAMEAGSPILHPDYQLFIPLKESRRMNEVIKMAIACSTDCLLQAGIEQPDAIILGTSMGCNHFTKTFLDKIVEAGDGLVSPTAFMLSTHNTIAGQISLALGNRRHNMTHTHNSLSFEHALIDAMLCIREGNHHVLVGAADELQNDLYDMRARLNNPTLRTASGASMFILTDQAPDAGGVSLQDVAICGLSADPAHDIHQFLQTNGIAADEIGLLLYASSNMDTLQMLQSLFPSSAMLDYQALSGAYYTHSSFALHYTIDLIQHSKDQKTGPILICNNLIPENLGMILIRR